MVYPKQSSVIVMAAVLVLTALLEGCTGRSDGTTGGSEVTTTPGQAAGRAPVTGAPPPAVAAPSAVPNQVTIDNFAFNPPVLTVALGTKVTWINRDDVPHTATSTAKPRAFDSGTLDTDDQFAHVFEAPGTYEYFCTVHPHMTGQIIVK